MMQFNIYEIVKIKIEPSKKTHDVKLTETSMKNRYIFL